MTFNGEVCRDLSTHFLELAEKQEASAPLVLGHNLVGVSALLGGDIAEGRAHLDQGIKHYDPSKDRPLALRIGQDALVTALNFRALALWILGYLESALSDAAMALQETREFGHAATVMTALSFSGMAYSLWRDFAKADLLVDELVTLAEQKGSLHWKMTAMAARGRNLALTGKSSEAIIMLTATHAASRSAGISLFVPRSLAILADAYADIGQFEDAWKSIGEAITTVEKTNERWGEAEICRTAGQIALKSSEPDPEKAEAYFQRALVVARLQQAKSWELRAAMSMARLRRDQGKPQQARELLAPVYGWFTEGFDTLDLKEAKALLEELA